MSVPSTRRSPILTRLVVELIAGALVVAALAVVPPSSVPTEAATSRATGARDGTGLAAVVAPEPISDAERAAAQPRVAQLSRDVVLTAGTSSVVMPAAEIAEAIAIGRAPDGRTSVRVEPAALLATVDRAKRRLAATGAWTMLRDKRGVVVGALAAAPEIRLDARRTAERIAAALERTRFVDLLGPLRVAAVDVSRDETPSVASTVRGAPRMTLVAAWATIYSPSKANGFGTNVTIPARDLDGVVVAPGETFSYWHAIGPVTRERGYLPGGVIAGGHSDADGALGGGMCTVSSTVFNAALRAGYAIVARKNHAYYIPRYPLGLDATVYRDDDRGVLTDMRWTNDSAYPVLIRTYTESGMLRVELYSVPTGRTVIIGEPLVSHVRHAVERVVPTNALRKGDSRRREVAADGQDVVVVRTVLWPDGRVTHDRFASDYRRVDGVLLVGTR